MKIKVDKIWSVLLNTFKQFPVEVCIMLYGFVMGVLWIAEVDVPHIRTLAFEPIFFVLAYALNNIFKQGSKYRLFYYLSWVPMMPLWLIDVSDWVESVPFLVLCVCAALGIFVCRWALDNRRFAIDGFRYVLNAAVALIFAVVTQLLIWGIYFSVVYIFNLGENFIPNFYQYSALFVYAVLCPTMYLVFVHNSIMTEREYGPSKFIDILLNYIITPALLIYTAILYVYFMKIAFTWELPNGWLSYMVFCFVMVAMFAKALQPLLGERYYDWFFNYFSIISVPAMIMFWVGALYRINEYGLTEARFYLLLCGFIMTATLVLFICSNWGKYIWVFIATGLILSLFTYIPSISAINIAKRSQTVRISKIAGEMGMLNGEGEFITEGYPELNDSLSLVKCDKIASSLRYLFRDSDSGEKILGLSDASEFTHMYGGISRDKGSHVYLYDAQDLGVIDISDYRYFARIDYFANRTDGGYHVKTEERVFSVYKSERNSNRLPVEEGDETWEEEFGSTLVFEISLDSLLSQQLASIGYTSESVLNREILNQHQRELLRYKRDDMLIMLSEMGIYLSASGPSLQSAEASFILIK